MTRRLALIGALALASAATTARAGEPIRPARERFAAADVAEVPDFQRHVLTLMGRVGCNTRSCHGVNVMLDCGDATRTARNSEGANSHTA